MDVVKFGPDAFRCVSMRADVADAVISHTPLFKHSTLQTILYSRTEGELTGRTKNAPKLLAALTGRAYNAPQPLASG